MGSPSEAFERGSISINLWEEKKFSLIGQSLLGSALRPRWNRSSTSALTLPTKRLTTCVKQPFHQSAAPPGQLQQATTLETCWKKPWERDSIRSPATRMVLKSTWLLSEERSNAA